MYSKEFWKDAFERILFTVLEVLAGFSAVDGFNLFAVDWKLATSVTVAAALGALVKTVAAARAGGTLSPASLAPVER